MRRASRTFFIWKNEGRAMRLAVADAGEEGDVAFGGDETAAHPAARTAVGRSMSSPRSRQGRVVTTAVPPGRSRCAALGEDVGEAVEESVGGDVGEVGGVVAVAEVLLDHAVFPGFPGGADLSVDAERRTGVR